MEIMKIKAMIRMVHGNNSVDIMGLDNKLYFGLE